MAGQCKSVRMIALFMLSSDNVLDVKGPKRIIVLMDSAVFASIACALAYKFACGFVYQE